MGLVVAALVAATGCAMIERPQMDVVTATNIFLLPEQAVSLTLQGIAADRTHAPEITAAAVTAAPDQEVAIESAALAAAPERAAEIRQAVAIARAQRDLGVSALPQAVAAPAPREAQREVVSNPSTFTSQFINGYWPTFRPRLRNDSSGAEGTVR